MTTPMPNHLALIITSTWPIRYGRFVSRLFQSSHFHMDLACSTLHSQPIRTVSQGLGDTAQPSTVRTLDGRPVVAGLNCEQCDGPAHLHFLPAPLAAMPPHYTDLGRMSGTPVCWMCIAQRPTTQVEVTWPIDPVKSSAGVTPLSVGYATHGTNDCGA